LIADGAPLAEPLRRLIGACAGTTLDGVTERNVDEKVLPMVRAMLMPTRAGHSA